MIQLERVNRNFEQDGNQVLAVQDLSLDIRKGETLCLIGSSGCGKTTTLRLLNRLLDPTDGRIMLDGQDTSTMEPTALRRRMGYVVQRGGLFPHLTVRANVGLLCTLEKWGKPRTEQRVSELLELVRLPLGEFGDRFPSELSGGQRQRVGVARALALDPEILLMDEPFGALDPVTRSELQSEFRHLEGLSDKTVVLVTHDLDEAFLLGDRIALMSRGTLLQVGDRASFLEEPNSEEVRRFVEGQHVTRTGGADG